MKLSACSRLPGSPGACCATTNPSTSTVTRSRPSEPTPQPTSRLRKACRRGQHDGRAQSKCGRLGDGLVRPEGSGRLGRQLGADHAWQRLEHAVLLPAPNSDGRQCATMQPFPRACPFTRSGHRLLCATPNQLQWAIPHRRALAVAGQTALRCPTQLPEDWRTDDCGWQVCCAEPVGRSTASSTGLYPFMSQSSSWLRARVPMP